MNHNPPPTQPSSEIQTRLDSLEKEIVKLMDSASVIKQRISPILTPEYPSSSGTGSSSDQVSAPYQGCKVGEKLLQLEEVVVQVSADLNRTIDRLAV